MIREWLQLSRIHLVALLLPLTLIGYRVTHPTIFSFDAIIWALFGSLWIITGNIHNAVTDYIIDKSDPNKQNHPLVKGKISVKRAMLVSRIFMLILYIWASIMVNFNPLLMLITLLGGICGILYNWFSKEHYVVPFLGGISIATPPLIAGLYNVDISTVTIFHPIIALYVAVSLSLVIVNGINGGYKDISSDPKNMLKWLGVYVKDNIIYNVGRVLTFNILLRSIMIIVLIPYISVYNYFIIPILFMLAIIQSKINTYDRKRVMRLIVLDSMIISYYLFIIVFGTLMQIDEIIFLLLFPPILYILSNKITWNSIISPKT